MTNAPQGGCKNAFIAGIARFIFMICIALIIGAGIGAVVWIL